MKTIESSSAWDIAEEAAQEGGTGSEVSARMKKQADDMRQAAAEVQKTRDEAQQKIAELTGRQTKIVSPQDVEQLQSAGLIDSPDVQYVGVMESPEALKEVATTITTTADDISAVVGGMKTDTLDEGVAGQAYQGQGGSAVIDVTSAMSVTENGGVEVNTAMLEGVKLHELQHEAQVSAWSSGSTDIGGGQTLSRLEVSEWDAMRVQPTIAFVSADYKRMYAKVSGLGLDAEVKKVATQTGDLEGLGRKIREKKGESAPDNDDDAPATISIEAERAKREAAKKAAATGMERKAG